MRAFLSVQIAEWDYSENSRARKNLITISLLRTQVILHNATYTLHVINFITSSETGVD